MNYQLFHSTGGVFGALQPYSILEQAFAKNGVPLSVADFHRRCLTMTDGLLSPVESHDALLFSVRDHPLAALALVSILLEQVSRLERSSDIEIARDHLSFAHALLHVAWDGIDGHLEECEVSLTEYEAAVSFFLSLSESVADLSEPPVSSAIRKEYRPYLERCLSRVRDAKELLALDLRPRDYDVIRSIRLSRTNLTRTDSASLQTSEVPLSVLQDLLAGPLCRHETGWIDSYYSSLIPRLTQIDSKSGLGTGLPLTTTSPLLPLGLEEDLSHFFQRAESDFYCLEWFEAKMPELVISTGSEPVIVKDTSQMPLSDYTFIQIAEGTGRYGLGTVGYFTVPQGSTVALNTTKSAVD